MSDSTNLYWTVYRNLEQNLLALAENIHFDDRQLGVYSNRIAELIVRCAVEIESIARSMYEKEDGNM